MKSKDKISIHWFRRDLRIKDNHSLFKALYSNKKVLLIFIFDTDIINELSVNDARISFIYAQLEKINTQLLTYKCSVLCLKGRPIEVFKNLLTEYSIEEVNTNKDYEPYAKYRDKEIQDFLSNNGIRYNSFKDQVIFSENDILKPDNSPYTVFTPYKNKWLKKFNGTETYLITPALLNNLLKTNFKLPELSDLGFKKSKIVVKAYDISNLENYKQNRDFPNLDSTSHLSVHLRFGTVSIREIINKTRNYEAFLSELIWREFFMQILFHFPRVVTQNFKVKYNNIKWRNNKEEFEKWKSGQTGYPIVDAGMRELNKTGYMHNRVRMIVASFLCKHLLIDWRWGEAYFAEKLLDYELASNNGNWQWAAGTGCDAAPYFRIFNPYEQTKKFDPKLEYINKWVWDLNSFNYPMPIIEHKFARKRALQTYKIAIDNN